MKRYAGLVGFFLLVVGFVAGGAPAHAAISLQRVQVTEGARVDLIFDGKVDPAAIKTEFFNDTVQLSMEGVNVYPAKITSVSGPDLLKIFAYQYSPGLVRCRFTLKGKAEDYKDKVRVSGDGKILSVRFSDDIKQSRRKQEMVSDAITLSARKPEKSPQSAQRAEEKSAEVAAVTADERTLLERVLGSNPEKAEEKEQVPRVAENDTAKAKAGAAAGSSATIRDARKSPAQAPAEAVASSIGAPGRLTSAPELPSPARSLGVLASICGALGLLVVLRRGFQGKGALKRIEGHKGLNGLLGNLGLGRNERLVEVLSNHSLGPRKSIAVVRVGGRRLVLGVTNESINLITAMDGADTNVGDAVAASLISSNNSRAGSSRSAPGASFEAALAGAAGAARTSGDSQVDMGMDLESLAMESAENPDLFKPTSRAAGASTAGSPRYAEPSLLRGGAASETATGAHAGVQDQASASADARSSAIRDRIRSRLGGMKQL